ncbi:hypothetical protein NHE_0441 [Neorickettsia helminthoeca str. Oregon]|uniref:Uncharacterized protein n=1 Tax=Neorickettsia helminthoeca str. Oregon TaxID=1286528 RepID=X5H493_9RICK|nr:hypothetical protein NHE_0441 [Neorickettsia helminthoeca str. Oregon]
MLLLERFGVLKKCARYLYGKSSSWLSNLSHTLEVHFTPNKTALALLCTFGILVSLLAGFLSKESSKISKTLYNLEHKSEDPHNLKSVVTETSWQYVEEIDAYPTIHLEAGPDKVVDPAKLHTTVTQRSIRGKSCLCVTEARPRPVTVVW